jgi:hypothetical protein
LNKKEKEMTVQVTKKELLDMVTYLIDNIFVKCGTKVFRQIIGIPMGTDCAPFLANLFLYKYEFQFMAKMAKTKNPDIYCFRRVQRYLDDLLLVNGGDVMDKYAKDIYPSELVLKKENNDDQLASFLCLFLTIKNNKLRYTLYDKRDDFPFQIVNYPNLSGHIYSSNAYGVLIGQLLRISEACEEYADFVRRSKRLVDKLLNQCFTTAGIKSRLTSFYERHPTSVRKYGIDHSHLLRILES